MTTLPLSGQLALVTGAARRVGRGIALSVAEAGADVVVHYGRSEAEAQQTARDIEALGRRAWPLSADLRSPEAITRLFGAIDALEAAPPLGLLVNSAASFERRPLLETGVDAWDAVQAVNTRAPFLCIQHAAPRMRASGGGVIINIVDLSARRVWPGYGAHGVSKAGLTQLTRAAAIELAPEIRVGAVCPGAMLPPPGMRKEDPEWAAMGEALPVARTGAPADIGRAVVFYATSPFMTGSVVTVDGGEELLTGGAHG